MTEGSSKGRKCADHNLQKQLEKNHVFSIPHYLIIDKKGNMLTMMWNGPAGLMRSGSK